MAFTHRPDPSLRGSRSGKIGAGCLVVVGVISATIVGILVVGGTAFMMIASALMPGGQSEAQKEAQQAQAAEQAEVQGQPTVTGAPDGVTSGGTYNIGTPDPSKLGTGYVVKGSADIDFDGSPHAYAPAGSGLVGEDNLANAGHPGNWYGIVTDNGRPDGNPVIGPDGYYISATSATFAQNSSGQGYESSGGQYLNADTTAYVALSTAQRNGAQLGDYVMVTNNSTGQSTWAVYGDSAGTIHNSDGQVEMSAATANAIGVGYNSHGTTSNDGSITYTVYPGSRNSGKPGGG